MSKTNPKEMWRQVPWATPYEVSDHGGVRKAINRCPSHRHRCKPWRYLTPDSDKDGYLKVKLTVNGTSVRWAVSRLVYAVWVSDLVDGLVVAHKNGIRDDNRHTNLVQTSQHQNIQHKRLHGTWQDKARHPNAIYTQQQVDQVRRALLDARFTASGRLARGEASKIAADVGVHPCFVTDVKSGRAWA